MTGPLMTTAPYHAGGMAYIAARDLVVGTVVARMTDQEPRSAPTRHTIQVARDRHVDVEQVRFLNHSCLPNTFVDTVAGQVVAIRPISGGELLTFFYPATEWEMACPFTCQCGHDVCLGEISGAVCLPARVLSRYAVSAHIRELVDERDRSAASVAG